MSVGLYLAVTLVMFLAFGLWIRGLVLRRLRPDRILADLNREVRTLIADLNQAGDHNISLLEDRIARLQDLLERSDRQIDDARMLLEYMETRSNGGSAYGGRIADRSGTADPVHTAAPDEVAMSQSVRSNTVVEEASTAGDSPAEAGEQERSEEARAVSHSRTETDDGDGRAAVLSLYNQGVSPELIAAHTGIAIGEVELVISLQGKRSWR